MSEIERWLAARRPGPPDELAGTLCDSLGGVREIGGPRAEALSEAGRERLKEARSHLGRVRESAFHLLAADALVTYACEAAMESEDPQVSLSRILDVAAEHDSP